jgi:hypothetical protein
MPVFCDNIINYFDSKKPEDLNATAISFVKKLKEKKEIDEGKN